MGTYTGTSGPDAITPTTVPAGVVAVPGGSKPSAAKRMLIRSLAATMLFFAAGSELFGAPSTGTLLISPTAEQLAGAVVPVTYTITTGSEGLQPGGYVLLHWSRIRGNICHVLSNVTATSSKPGAVFGIRVNADAGDAAHLYLGIVRLTLLSGGALGPGAKITVRGNLRYGNFVTCRETLQGVVHPTGTAVEYVLPNRYPISVKNGPMAKVWVTAEARPLAGAKGRLTVAVVDKYGNAATNFTGTITASANVPVVGLPNAYTFTGADAGAKDFAVTFPIAGRVTRITATAGGVQGVSNPILPRTASELGIYFGDIHNHSTLSKDGIGDPDNAYLYGRRIAGLDFGALSDHDPKEPSTTWTKLRHVANRYNQPGRFVTLLGYEFSSDLADGHRNVYYQQDGPGEPNVSNNMEELWAYLDSNNLQALTIPHHPNAAAPNGTWKPTNWSLVNTEYQRLVEIFQGRGSFELPGPDPELKVREPDHGASVQVALDLGHRIGFIGSTDGHYGMIGTPTGVTGVYSSTLARKNIFDRMYARQCYAVSGDRMLLFFTVNGRPMGSELRLAPKTKLVIKWRAIGQTAIKRVDLLRNNDVFKSWLGGAAADMTATVNATRLSGREWWYLRVIQTNGELGWTSPIWVDPT